MKNAHQVRIEKRRRKQRRMLIVPFIAVARYALFRYKEEWWTKDLGLNKKRTLSPLAISFPYKKEKTSIAPEALVAAFMFDVCTTQHKNAVDDFYA